MFPSYPRSHPLFCFTPSSFYFYPCPHLEFLSRPPSLSPFCSPYEHISTFFFFVKTHNILHYPLSSSQSLQTYQCSSLHLIFVLFPVPFMSSLPFSLFCFSQSISFLFMSTCSFPFQSSVIFSVTFPVPVEIHVLFLRLDTQRFPYTFHMLVLFPHTCHVCSIPQFPSHACPLPPPFTSSACPLPPVYFQCLSSSPRSLDVLVLFPPFT